MRFEETTMATRTSKWFAAVLAAALLVVPSRAFAQGEQDEKDKPEESESSTAELQEQIQNPVADLISVPFQNNIGYNIGAFDRASWILNIQPVVPIHITESWMVVTRTIIPFVYQPDVQAMEGSTSGMGDINPTVFLAPVNPGKLIWGVGPTFLFPTATQTLIGTGKWGIGPSAVGLLQTKHWTVGALANNIWSYAGDSDRASINQFLLQYFVTYNLPKSWYLTSSPILTANWKAASGDKWTVPFGGGFGKIIRLGKLPLNAQIQAFADPIRPDTTPAPTWEVRFQVAFLFPTAKPKPKSSETAAAPAPAAASKAIAVGGAPAKH
jgi:hypothetical protein